MIGKSKPARPSRVWSVLEPQCPILFVAGLHRIQEPIPFDALEAYSCLNTVTGSLNRGKFQSTPCILIRGLNRNKQVMWLAAES